MNEQQYRELEDLRKYLSSKSKQRLKLRIDIRELQRNTTTFKAEKTAALKEKQYYMEIDKELRSTYELTNQSDWKKKIKELTRSEEEEINAAITTMEDELQSLKDELEVVNIRITDTEWELTLKNGYYQDNPELVNVTPVKEAV